MRDYIAWYLIELRRRLTNVDPQGRVEDFLLETRTHLQESIDDMTSRGIAEDAATKSAIADFGHPSLVAQAFRGRRIVGPVVYWILVAITAVVLGAMSGGFVASVGDTLIGDSPRGQFSLGNYAGIAFFAVGVIALLSRRWAAVPISIGCTVCLIAAGFYVESQVKPFALSAEADYFLLMDERNVKFQRELRDEWLARYASGIEPIKSELARHAAAPMGARIKSIEAGDGLFYYPDNRYPRENRPYSVLPDYEGFGSDRIWYWRSLGSPELGNYVLAKSDSYTLASEAWIKDGIAFLAYADEVKNAVVYERKALEQSAPIARPRVIARTIGVPLMLFGTFALFGLLMNALILGLTDLVAMTLRRSWKRRLS